MAKVSYGKRKVRYMTYKRVPIEHKLEDGVVYSRGFKSEPDKHMECEVELIVDVDALFDELALTAAKNKTGKSVDAGGAVMARRVSVPTEVI